jgi:hypothetical protein
VHREVRGYQDLDEGFDCQGERHDSRAR